MIPFFLIVSGFVFAIQKPYKILIFGFIIQFFLLWFTLKYYPNDYSSVGTLNTIFLYASVGFFYFKFPQHFRNFLNFYFLFIVGFIVMIYLHSKIYSYPIYSSIGYFRNFFHSFLFFSIASLVVKEYRFVSVFNFLLVFFTLTSVLYLFQYFVPPIKYFLVIEYIYRNGEFLNLISEEILKGNPAIGTFIRPANLGNVLAVFIPFYYYLYSTSRLNINRMIFWITFILFVFTLISTGIRTSFVSFMFCQVGFILLLYRKRLIFVVIGLMCAAIFVTVISSNLNLEFYERADFSSPLMRVFYLFNYFDQDSSIIEESTLSRSSNIFAYYESFFLGSGFMSSGGIVQGISSITDLTLAFIFVEYGFIILVLSLIPFFFPVLRILRNRGRGSEFYISLILFFTLILQTITDQGLFTNYCSYMYFFTTAYFIFHKT